MRFADPAVRTAAARTSARSRSGPEQRSADAMGGIPGRPEADKWWPIIRGREPEGRMSRVVIGGFGC